MVVLVWVGVSIPAHSQPLAPYELFERVWGLVETKFYQPGLNGVNSEILRQEARQALSGVSQTEAHKQINAYLTRLGASHTRLLNSSEPAYYELLDIFSQGALSGEILALFGGKPPHYEGILATVESGVVRDVLPGGPADVAGLQAGDIVVSVAGEEYHPINSFRGKAGRKVRLEIVRAGRASHLEVTPEEIQPRAAFLRSVSASARLVDSPPYQLGYVRMWSYAGEDFQDALRHVLKTQLAKADGLVLDLRGTWGGASPDFVHLFSSQPELKLISREGVAQTLESDSFNKPLVVLIDSTVTSGKEVMAYSLQRSGRARIVGQKTRGAVVGGGLHLLPDGHALYLAQHDATVDGNRLEGIGVFPDTDAKISISDGPDDLPRTGQLYLRVELIKQELERRGNLDQYSPSDWSSEQLSNWQQSVFAENSRWLKLLLGDAGWPSRSVFGERASVAWLIAQHSADLELQKQCLIRLQQAVAAKEAPAQEAAYLEDRILVNQGLPQIYGTQVHRIEGKIQVRTLRDYQTVNLRRHEVGLPPIEEYLRSFPQD